MPRLFWLSFAVVVFDQITKLAAVEYLANRPPLEIVPVFDLVLVFNSGAAFGLLKDAGGWQNAAFIGVALVVSVFLLYAVWRAQQRDLQVAVAMALILGGAIGNVIDRVTYGYVIDFIDLHYRAWHWPAFNIADAAISVGAVLLVLDAFGWRIMGERLRTPEDPVDDP